MKEYFVYIMSSNNTQSIYTGVTNSLQKRVNEHKNYVNDSFSSKYNCVNLVYFEKFNVIEKAIKREKQLKAWKREWKNDLIKKDNPKFYDLAIDWNS
jgi:putative endonuclease